jgi:hypothetical protein
MPAMKAPVAQRLVGLAALLLLAACGGVRAARGPAPLIDADTSITLERTACFGLCPAYSLSIQGEGSVSYLGTSFVKVVGDASSQVTVSDVQGLVDEMWDAGYLDMTEPSPCSATITDAPMVITSLTLAAQTHRVAHYRGNPCSPSALTTIEDRIDEVAGSQRWLRCDTPSGYCPSGY